MKYISKKTFLVLMIFVSIISVLTYFVYFFNQPAKAYISQTNSRASLVIGQADIASNSANQGGAGFRNANTLYSPRGLLFAEGKLLVADSLNHRVLIFNSLP